MSYSFLRRLLPFVLLACLPVVSQQIRAVKIGVALPSSRRDQSSAKETRDALVRQLNRRQIDRKRNIALQAIALEASPGGDAIAEGVARKCDFLIYLRVEAVEQSILPVKDADGAVSNQELDTALLEYQLRRVTDGATYSIGMAKGERSPSREEAILDAVDEIPNKVAEDIGNLGSPESSRVEPGDKMVAGLNWGEQPTAESCAWLPRNLPHSHALQEVCRFAMTQQEKMPNFMCQQSTARYRGNQRSPMDLITATVRYVDGEESYRDLKRNGRELPGAVWNGVGLWSSGQFEGNLRAIFYQGNRAAFTFVRNDKLDSRAVWVFHYQIARQNEPLWELRAEGQLAAPPYEGDLWVDQKTETVWRFSSTATSLPTKFPMRGAEVQTDYERVAFPDGTGIVLPARSTITSRFEGREPTRNVIEFRACRMFKATAKMVTNAPAELSQGDFATGQTAAELKAELEENETIYGILREEAIAQDAALAQIDQFQTLRAATGAAFWKMAQIRRQRQQEVDSLARSVRPKERYGIDVDANGNSTFKIYVRLVPVTVVVRDKKGNAVGSLTKADFQLLDNKKAQEILSFSVQENEQQTGKSGSPPVKVQPDDLNNVAYVFDDLHATVSDLMQARTAAEKHLRILDPSDRVALFTTSGEVALDYTSDLDKLRAALARLKSHSHANPADCPAMTYYVADMILNQGDQNAMSMAMEDAFACEFPDRDRGGAAAAAVPGGGGTFSASSGVAGIAQMGAQNKSQQLVLAKAYEVASTGKMESDRSLSTLNDALTRTAGMPGRKTIILLSPGFMTVTRQQQEGAMELIEHALRAEVTFSTLDVQGLKEVNLGADRGRVSASVTSRTLGSQEGNETGGVMADLAYGTGGTYFSGNNNLDEALRRLTEPPRYTYLIGFTPERLDGKFHKLKVTVKGQQKLTVQARPGYYALKPKPGS